MSRYKTQAVNTVGLDEEAATILAVVAKAVGMPKQKLASAVISEVLTERIIAGLYGEEDD